MRTNAALNDAALEVSSWIQLEVTTKCNVVNGFDDDDLWEHFGDDDDNDNDDNDDNDDDDGDINHQDPKAEFVPKLTD